MATRRDTLLKYFTNLFQLRQTFGGYLPIRDLLTLRRAVEHAPDAKEGSNSRGPLLARLGWRRALVLRDVTLSSHLI